jgi:hypothetical protein
MQVNYKFFDPPWTKVKGRVLGFFIADGHLRISDNSLSFSQADPAVLMEILRLMDCDAEVKKKKGRKEWVVTICNGHLVDRLGELGFDNHKTSTAIIPAEIPLEVLPDLIGGDHEGDGSIGFETERDGRRICGYVQFLGTESVLEDIRRHLISRGVSESVNVHPHGSTKTFALKYKGHEDVIRLIRLLYPDGGLTLTRKRAQALEVLRWETELRAAEKRRTSEHNQKIMLSNIITRGREWPDLVAPDGTRHRVLSTGDIARKHGLTPAGVWAVLTGTQKQHKGWKKVDCADA